MASTLPLHRRLRLILRPTPGQALLVSLVAVLLLAYAFNVQLMASLGISSAAINVLTGSIKTVLHPVLISTVTENAVLIAFWSGIGLAAYLVSWGFYSIGVAARNDLTIATRYANQGRVSSPYGALIIKTVCAVILILILVSLAPGIHIWLDVATPLFNGLSLGGIVGIIVGTVGLALQLYLVLVAVQLTFLPWYRPEAFTSEA